MFNLKEDLGELPVDILLLLEEKHIKYLMERDTENLRDLSLVLRESPYLAWYFKKKDFLVKKGFSW